MDMTEVIFKLLGITAGITGIICGIYAIIVAHGYVGDKIARGNMFGMGICYLILGVTYTLASLKILGFDAPTPMTPFSMLARSLAILGMLFPTFVMHRMNRGV